MKRSIINITMDSNCAEVLFEDRTIEKINLTQSKFELYKSAKLQIDELTMDIKKNRNIGWLFTGVMWILLPFYIFNVTTSYTVLSAAFHKNITLLITLSGLFSTPFHLKSLHSIMKRDKITSNIDSINEKLDKYAEYEVSDNYFMNKDLSVKGNSPLYTELIVDLNKELMSNPIKHTNAWEFQSEDDVQNNFGNLRHMNEKLCAEEVQFEMVSNTNEEKALVMTLKR